MVSCSGASRSVAVGRVKIERRPLVMILARSGDVEGSVVLQNAETVHLVGGDGNPISVKDLKEGSEVIVHLGQKLGRHIGVQVDEYLLER